MTKTILVTGATDGIGLETARTLVALGHRVLLHGRSLAKVEKVAQDLSAGADDRVFRYVADLSDMRQVLALSEAVAAEHSRLDVLINNAGVFRTANPRAADGLDVRFAVNTVAPYLLTQRLLPRLGAGRVLNLSSAAQASVDMDALAGRVQLSDGAAYAQSKLALTSWSRSMARSLGDKGPAIIAVNPGSMLGTKMVKEAFGVAGGDVRVGVTILVRLALDEEFQSRSGQYFDNDSGRFAPPHPDALEDDVAGELVRTMDSILAAILSVQS